MKHQVNITINSQFAERVVGFLVTNQISFEVSFKKIEETFDNYYAETPPQQFRLHEFPVKFTQELDPFSSVKNSVSPLYANINKVVDNYLMNNFDKPIPNTPQIAKECGVKVSFFRTYFMQQYGKPFYKLYIEQKMEYAAKLLKKGYKCNEVTVMVGYSENAAIKFNKMFQKHFGISPKKYQMEHYGKIDRRTRRTKSQL